jgi:hypothetical protein
MAVEINWQVLSLFIIIIFAMSGFSRGWWKEAITTVLLAGLVLLLQQPNLAESFVGFLNKIVALIWGLIPDSLKATTVDSVGATLGFISTDAPQFDASSSSTWFFFLGIIMIGSIIFGRSSLGNQPTLVGRVIGLAGGVLNGFLTISIAREYLDGRALPGTEELANNGSPIPIISSNTYAPPSETYIVQFSNLPSQTILDNIVPWLILGAGGLLLVSLLVSRINFDRSPQGAKISTKLPPYYRKPAPKPQSFTETLTAVVRRLT